MKYLKFYDWATKSIIYSSTLLVLISIGLLFIAIIGFAVPVLINDGLLNSLQLAWSPKNNEYGILAILIGTCLVSFLALIFATPIALVTTLWLVGLGKGFPRLIILYLIKIMASIPTVVYGFIAIFLLTPIIRNGLGGSGLSWLTASIMVALLILPTMIFILLTGFEAQFKRMQLCGTALGLTSFEILCHLVLPASYQTMIAAILLGMGRAMGDTLLPLMLAGNAIHIPSGLSDNLRTLTAHMALVTANEVGGAAYNSLFVAGLLLLLISVSIRLITQKILSHLSR